MSLDKGGDQSCSTPFDEVPLNLKIYKEFAQNAAGRRPARRERRFNTESKRKGKKKRRGMRRNLC